MSTLLLYLHKILLGLWILGLMCGSSLAQVQLYGAASLTRVLSVAGQDFETRTGIEVNLVVAGSSTLAQQIAAGAPADIYVSANRSWLSFVQEKSNFGLGKPLFGNRLVVVAPNGGKIVLEELSKLVGVLGEQRLALGNPAHVPAGIYAQQALKNVAIWDTIKDRMAPTSNVRAALRLVVSGAAPFGIVYASDALNQNVQTILQIDPDLHEEITYWGAVSLDAGDEAKAFFAYLQGQEMTETALDFGFFELEGE